MWELVIRREIVKTTTGINVRLTDDAVSIPTEPKLGLHRRERRQKLGKVGFQGSMHQIYWFLFELSASGFPLLDTN